MESELRTVVCVTTPIALLAIWEYKTLAFLLKPSFLPSFLPTTRDWTGKYEGGGGGGGGGGSHQDTVMSCLPGPGLLHHLGVNTSLCQSEITLIAPL